MTVGWGVLVYTGSIDTIWPMFGIANQLLAVVALALVTTLLVNTGRGRYAPVTILPMLFVTATTMTAAAEMVGTRFPAMIQGGQVLKGGLSMAMTIFVIACVGTLLLLAMSRWIMVWRGTDWRAARDGTFPEMKEMVAPVADGATKDGIKPSGQIHA